MLRGGTNATRFRYLHNRDISAMGRVGAELSLNLDVQLLMAHDNNNVNCDRVWRLECRGCQWGRTSERFNSPFD